MARTVAQGNKLARNRAWFRAVNGKTIQGGVKDIDAEAAVHTLPSVSLMLWQADLHHIYPAVSIPCTTSSNARGSKEQQTKFQSQQTGTFENHHCHCH